MPKRKRTESRNAKGQRPPAGRAAVSRDCASQHRPARDQDCEQVPSAKPVAEQAAGHLEKAVGNQERGRQLARLRVIQAERLLDLRQAVRKAKRCT